MDFEQPVMSNGDELESLPDAETLQKQLDNIKAKYDLDMVADSETSSTSSFTNMETELDNPVGANMPAILSQHDIEIKKLLERLSELELQLKMERDDGEQMRMEAEQVKAALQEEIRVLQEQYQAIQLEREQLISQMQAVRQQKDEAQQRLTEECRGLKTQHGKLEEDLKQSELNCAQYLRNLLKVTNQLKTIREQNAALRRQSGSTNSIDYVMIPDQQANAQSGTPSPEGSNSGSTSGALDLDTSRLEVTTLQQQLSERNISMAKLNETITVQRQQIEEQLSEITTLNQKISELGRRPFENTAYGDENLKAELRRKTDQLNAIQQQRDDLRREVLAYQQASSDTDIYQDQYKHDLKRLRSEIKIKTERISSLLQELEEKQVEFDSELIRLNQQLSQQRAEITRYKHNVQEKEEFQQLSQVKQEEVSTLNKKLADLTKENDTLKQMAGDTESRITSLQKTQESLTHDLQRQNEYIENKQNQLDAVNQKCAELERQVSQAEEDGRKQLFEQSKRKEQNIRSIEERHEDKVNQMKKDRDTLQSDLDSTREKLLIAKKENESYIEKIKQQEADKDQLMKSMKGQHSAALERAREENTRLTQNFEYTNSQLQQKAVEFQQLRNALNKEIQDLKEALEKKTAEHENVSEGIGILQAHYKTLNEEKQAITGAEENSRREKMKLENQLKMLRDNFTELERAMEEVRVDRNQVLTRLTEKQTEVQNAQATNRQLERNNAELQQQADLLPALQAQMDLFKADFDAERKSREELAAKKNGLEERLRDQKLEHDQQLKGFQDHANYLLDIIAENSNIPRSQCAAAPQAAGAGGAAQQNQARAAAPQAAQPAKILCPVCGHASPDYDSHQLHTMDCLPE